MQPLAQGEENEGQAWWVRWTGAKYGNSAARLQFQHTNNIKRKKKKEKTEVETTSFLLITSSAKQDPTFYHLFCDVKYHDDLGLLCENLKEFNWLYMPILVKTGWRKNTQHPSSYLANSSIDERASKCWPPLSHRNFLISAAFTRS